MLKLFYLSILFDLSFKFNLLIILLFFASILTIFQALFLIKFKIIMKLILYLNYLSYCKN